MSTPTFDPPAALRALVERGVPWPRTRGEHEAAPTRRSAVLLLFGVREDPGNEATRGASSPADLDLLLVRRSTRLRHHPGQVALPGGGVEPGDADDAATALREAREETGVDPAGVDVLGALDPIPVVVSGNLVTPVVAWWRIPGPVHAADADEIDLVARIPLTHLVDPARRVRAEIGAVPTRTAAPGATTGSLVRTTPGVELDRALLWGFTGIVVTTVLAELGWGPRTDWDVARAVDAANWTPPPSPGPAVR